MRIRTVKPEFWTHPVMSRLEPTTQLLALALLNYADDHGYFRAEPELVRAACCPFTEASVSIHGGLTTLLKVGWIEVRNTGDTGVIGRITKWQKHQRVNRPSASKLMPYWLTESSLNPHGRLTEASLPEQGTGNRERNTPIVPLSGDNQPEELGEELVLDSTPVDEAPSTDGDLAWVKLLVRMRASTALDASGERAWKKARAIVAATPEEDRVVLTAFYGADRSAKEYWRQEAATLLNHWQGEIAKAHDWARRSGFSASAEKSEKKETWGGSFEDLQVVYAAWWRRDYGDEEMPPCVPFDRMDSWMQREVLAFVAGIVEQKPGAGQEADEGRAA
jgi:hypothetical protein